MLQKILFKKFRFEDEKVRNKLLKFDLAKINYSDASKFFDVLYDDVTKENIDSILETFDK